MELDEAGLWEIGRRNRTLIRAINVRRGMRRKDEVPPQDHWAIRDHEFEQKLLDDYYVYKGWNNDGIPTGETLNELGLDYVRKDFEQRGILTDNDGVPPDVAAVGKEKNSGGGRL
jgi:aldehyde:ferredoxin oxidoreductase